MARIVVSALADAHMARILDDLTKDAGFAVATRYNAEIESLYDRLSRFPESCQRRPALGPNIRVGVVRPYLVVYRYAKGAEAVGVVRILHGSRNITRRLLSGDT